VDLESSLRALSTKHNDLLELQESRFDENLAMKTQDLFIAPALLWMVRRFGSVRKAILAAGQDELVASSGQEEEDAALRMVETLTAEQLGNLMDAKEFGNFCKVAAIESFGFTVPTTGPTLTEESKIDVQAFLENRGDLIESCAERSLEWRAEVDLIIQKLEEAEKTAKERLAKLEGSGVDAEGAKALQEKLEKERKEMQAQFEQALKDKEAEMAGMQDMDAAYEELHAKYVKLQDDYTKVMWQMWLDQEEVHRMRRKRAQSEFDLVKAKTKIDMQKRIIAASDWLKEISEECDLDAQVERMVEESPQKKLLDNLLLNEREYKEAVSPGGLSPKVQLRDVPYRIRNKIVAGPKRWHKLYADAEHRQRRLGGGARSWSPRGRHGRSRSPSPKNNNNSPLHSQSRHWSPQVRSPFDTHIVDVPTNETNLEQRLNWDREERRKFMERLLNESPNASVNKNHTESLHSKFRSTSVEEGAPSGVLAGGSSSGMKLSQNRSIYESIDRSPSPHAPPGGLPGNYTTKGIAGRVLVSRGSPQRLGEFGEPSPLYGLRGGHFVQDKAKMKEQHLSTRNRPGINHFDGFNPQSTSNDNLLLLPKRTEAASVTGINPHHHHHHRHKSSNFEEQYASIGLTKNKDHLNNYGNSINNSSTLLQSSAGHSRSRSAGSPVEENPPIKVRGFHGKGLHGSGGNNTIRSTAANTTIGGGHSSTSISSTTTGKLRTGNLLLNFTENSTDNSQHLHLQLNTSGSAALMGPGSAHDDATHAVTYTSGFPNRSWHTSSGTINKEIADNKDQQQKGKLRRGPARLGKAAQSPEPAESITWRAGNVGTVKQTYHYAEGEHAMSAQQLHSQSVTFGDNNPSGDSGARSKILASQGAPKRTMPKKLAKLKRDIKL